MCYRDRVIGADVKHPQLTAPPSFDVCGYLTTLFAVKLNSEHVSIESMEVYSTSYPQGIRWVDFGKLENIFVCFASNLFTNFNKKLDLNTLKICRISYGQR